MTKALIPRYYQTINGVKTEVVQQRFADVEWEEVEVYENGMSKQFKSKLYGKEKSSKETNHSS